MLFAAWGCDLFEIIYLSSCDATCVMASLVLIINDGEKHAIVHIIWRYGRFNRSWYCIQIVSVWILCLVIWLKNSWMQTKIFSKHIHLLSIWHARLNYHRTASLWPHLFYRKNIKQDKKLKLSLNGNRKVTGTLRGYDAFLNVVLENASSERGEGGQEEIGTIVIRGNSIIQFESVDRVVTATWVKKSYYFCVNGLTLARCDFGGILNNNMFGQVF